MFLFALIGSLMLLTACEKETNKERLSNLKSADSELLTIAYTKNGQNYYFRGDNLLNFLTWSYTDNTNKEVIIGNVLLKIDELPDAIILSVEKSRIEFEIGGKNMVFDRICSSTNNIQMSITGENEVFDFSISHASSLLPDFTQIYSAGQIITFDQKCPWCIIYGGVCIIAMLVDAYCDDQAAVQVHICTKYGYCSELNSCGADCVPCN